VKKNRVRANLNIRAENIRLIDEDGQMAGVIPLSEGLKLAEEKGVDLVQITDKVEPPVCKVIDLGKYMYNLEKKEKKARKQVKTGELKGVRISFKISEHDMKTAAAKAKGFLEKGNKVKVEIVLKGREKYLNDYWKEKMAKFLEMIEELTEIKIEKELKKEGRGASVIISKIQN